MLTDTQLQFAVNNLAALGLIMPDVEKYTIGLNKAVVGTLDNYTVGYDFARVKSVKQFKNLVTNKYINIPEELSGTLILETRPQDYVPEGRIPEEKVLKIYNAFVNSGVLKAGQYAILGDTINDVDGNVFYTGKDAAIAIRVGDEFQPVAHIGPLLYGQMYFYDYEDGNYKKMPETFVDEYFNKVAGVVPGISAQTTPNWQVYLIFVVIVLVLAALGCAAYKYFAK